MNVSLLNRLGREIGILLSPIGVAVEDPRAFERLLQALGVLSRDHNELRESLTDVVRLAVNLEELVSQQKEGLDAAEATLDLSETAFSLLRSLNNRAETDPNLKQLGRDLVDVLLAAWLARRHPIAREVAVLLTLVEPAEYQPLPPAEVSAGEMVRVPNPIDRLRLGRIVDLLRDPVATLRAPYISDLQTDEDAHAVADRLFSPILRLLSELGVSCRYGISKDDEPLLGETAAFMSHALVVYIEDELNGAEAEAGIAFAISPATRGDLGLVIMPFGAIATTRDAGEWTIEWQLTAGVDVVAYGRHGLTLLASSEVTKVAGNFVAELQPPEEGEPAFVVGASNGTRLEVGGTRFSITTSLTETHQTLALSWDVSRAALVVGTEDADGFVTKVLPATGMRADLDLGLAWSSEAGLRLRGSGGLEGTWSVGRSIGGLTLSTVQLGLHPGNERVETELSATLTVRLGPIQATIDRLGLSAVLAFPEEGANLGVADLTIRFKPPSGVGLVIDTAGVTGGGYLFFDPDKAEYAGVLQLELAETIALTAIGLLTTRLPDGSKGFSLIISITAEGFQPIQLGLGFRLSGIGGLIGVNRTVAVDVLRAGLKQGALDAVLFPENPVRNAAQIISSIRKVFPPANGRVVFGPMVVIDWGTPPVVTMDLAVILEVPSPVRLIVLGQVRAALPREGRALIQLKMDVLGVLELDKGELAIDAVLYDSRMLTFVVSGDMALRARWLTDPTFVMAAGGLNPNFTPPPRFPTLKRLAISLTNGDNPRLRLEAYLALTSNTAQIGARLDLRVAAAGFSIEGYLHFDALLEFSPFQFTIDIGAGVILQWHGRTLVGVQLALTLSGPSPWHAKGKATFKIWVFSKSVSFDKTFGKEERPPALPPVDPLPDLLAALRDARSWSGGVPAGSQGLVSVRETPGAALRVHPLGRLAVRQRVVPLETEIARFGNSVPARERRFRITAVQLDGAPVSDTRQLTDYFAPGQFLQMTDAQRLSRPSFEQLPSGIELGGTAVRFGGEEAAALMTSAAAVYETVTISSSGQFERPTTVAPLSEAAFMQSAELGAAARAWTQRPGGGKYRGERHDVTPQPSTYVVVHQEDLQLAVDVDGNTPEGTSYTAAAEALSRHVAAHPEQRGRLKVVAAHELARVA